MQRSASQDQGYPIADCRSHSAKILDGLKTRAPHPCFAIARVPNLTSRSSISHRRSVTSVACRHPSALLSSIQPQHEAPLQRISSLRCYVDFLVGRHLSPGRPARGQITNHPPRPRRPLLDKLGSQLSTRDTRPLRGRWPIDLFPAHALLWRCSTSSRRTKPPRSRRTEHDDPRQQRRRPQRCTSPTHPANHPIRRPSGLRAAHVFLSTGGGSSRRSRSRAWAYCS